MSQQSKQPAWINWTLTVAIIGIVPLFTGPIPGFWDNVYKQVIVIRDEIFQSPPVQKNEIIIRKEVPIESQP